MAYVIDSYSINYDGGLTSTVMLRIPGGYSEENGVLIWSSYHRNNIPNPAGPNGDNSWTQVYRTVIPGGVGNNEFFTLYFKVIDVGNEPSSYTLSRSGGSGNESTTAVLARVVGATGVQNVTGAYNFGNTTTSILAPAGGLTYYMWGSALGGGLSTPSPAGLDHVAGPIYHNVGAKMHSYYRVHQREESTGGYTGSYQSGADHNASVVSAWKLTGGIMRLTATTATASNTVTCAIPPIGGE